MYIKERVRMTFVKSFLLIQLVGRKEEKLISCSCVSTDVVNLIIMNKYLSTTMLLGVKASAGKLKLLCPAIVMQFHTSDHFSDRKGEVVLR